MRIAVISSLFTPPGIGGYVRHLAGTLAARAHEVVVLTRGRMTGGFRQAYDGFRVVWVPFAPIPPVHLALHKPFLDRALSREGPFDVVNVHTPLCPPVETVSPIVTTVHTPLGADIAHEEERDLRSRMGRFLVRGVSVPAERELLRRSLLTLATSEGVAKDLRAMGLPAGDVRVVGNGVDTDRFHPPGAGPRVPAEVLYVGRLGTRKGLNHLIAAFALLREFHPEASVRIVGKGPLRAAVLSQVKRLELNGSVHLEGFLPPEELAAAYRRATCVVVPSLYEGLSTVLLEAMASGAPVVATAVSGSVDVVEDRVNGRLVAPTDDQMLAEAIQEIIRDPAEAARLGQAARQTIEEGHTWDHVTSRYEAAFGAARR